MRAGWNDREINAPDLARRVEDAGAAAVTVHGRTAAQSYSGHADWDLVARVAAGVSIPVLGSGDCVEPEQVVERRANGVRGVLVGRGVLRNPWVLAQAADIVAGRAPRPVTSEMRGRFLLDYVDLLLGERVNEADGFRHMAPTADGGVATHRPAHGRERWVINKIRALNAWFSRRLDGGSDFRVAVNQAESIAALRGLIERFFLEAPPATDRAPVERPAIR
jgi:tRNA-dihydrouridine synthase B